MQFSKLTVYIAAITAHHKIGDNFYVSFPHDQDISTIQTLRIFNLNKNARFFLFIYKIFPICNGYRRCCDINLAVYKGIKCGSGCSHADIGDLANGILFNIRKDLFRRCRLRIRLWI